MFLAALCPVSAFTGDKRSSSYSGIELNIFTTWFRKSGYFSESLPPSRGEAIPASSSLSFLAMILFLLVFSPVLSSLEVDVVFAEEGDRSRISTVSRGVRGKYWGVQGGLWMAPQAMN